AVALDHGEGRVEAGVLRDGAARAQCRQQQHAGSEQPAHQARTGSPGTDVASVPPVTLGALRPMSRKVSMPMIISSPASGIMNWLSVAAMTTSEARGTPATPLEVTIRVASMANCVPSVISIP